MGQTALHEDLEEPIRSVHIPPVLLLLLHVVAIDQHGSIAAFLNRRLNHFLLLLLSRKHVHSVFLSLFLDLLF